MIMNKKHIAYGGVWGSAIIIQAGWILFCLISLQSALMAETNWPRFRGADGSGRSTDNNVPVKWSPADVAWRTELEGQGHSSPCLWGEKIFLTSACKKDEGIVERMVVCIDRGSGKIEWKQLAVTGKAEKVHEMNGFATSTCVADGERVVAFFGLGGIHCYDFQGRKLWSRDLGEFPGIWGTGASPVIIDDKVIQNCDIQGESSLLAMNIKTGETIWKANRGNIERGGWSTPILIDTGSRKELILHGEYGVNSYDPETGKDYWFCKGFNGRGTPSPVFSQNLIMVISGKPGDTYAIRPGGDGDVTETHMAWHTARKKGRHLSSPVIEKNYLLVAGMEGTGLCYDVPTGKELWQEKIEGRYTASLLAAGGLVYFLNESGKTLVIRPGDKLDIVAFNDVGAKEGEIFRASPVPSQGQFFIRSDRAIYCVGKRSR